MNAGRGPAAAQGAAPRCAREVTLRRVLINRFREFVQLRCRPLIVAMGTAGETACPTLLDQSFGDVGGAGGFACRWKLISIAPNPENGYARPAHACPLSPR